MVEKIEINVNLIGSVIYRDYVFGLIDGFEIPDEKGMDSILNKIDDYLEGRERFLIIQGLIILDDPMKKPPSRSWIRRL